MEILLIEDNPRISGFLTQGLTESGYGVTLSENGTDARRLIASREWDLILLDIMLPGIDGIELLQYARFKKIYTPVLVISALDDPHDKVKALDLGADDYLAKPFHFNELLSRIRALLRRTRGEYDPERGRLHCGDLLLDPEAHTVTRAGREIQLTQQEFSLLRLLMENRDKTVTRSRILSAVWGNQSASANVVDVYISYLRGKIEQPGSPRLIRTVKGVGYRITDKA